MNIVAAIRDDDGIFAVELETGIILFLGEEDYTLWDDPDSAPTLWFDFEECRAVERAAHRGFESEWSRNGSIH